MKKTFLSVGIAILLSFVGFALFWNLSDRPSKKQVLADEIRSQTVKKICTNTPLRPFGSGGQMHYEIVMLNIGFLCLKEINLPEARKLLVYATETLIDNVNSTEAIRPYLKNYPFTANNVEIDIWIRNSYDTRVALGKLRYATSRNGTLEYYLETTNNFSAEPFFTEPYNEAVTIVNSQKQRVIP